MNIHENARLTPIGRERIVGMAADGRSAAAIAACVGCIVRHLRTRSSSACRELGLRHIRTRPYTPKTNGKAERFIQTALWEWACARPYAHSVSVWKLE